MTKNEVSFYDGLVGDLKPEDEDGYVDVPELLSYVKIRQKELRENGKIVRNAGGFCFGATKQPTEEDVGSLSVIILGTADIRTYFSNPDSKEPSCGSRNTMTADDWGMKDQNGDPQLCGACPVNDVCNVNMQFFVWERHRQELLCLQFTPGARQPWRNFNSNTLKGMRSAFYQQHNRYPTTVPWFKLVVDVSTEYIDRKGGYYVPVFSIDTVVNPKDVEMMRGLRERIATVIEKTKASGAAGGGVDPQPARPTATEVVASTTLFPQSENPGEGMEDDLPF